MGKVLEVTSAIAGVGSLVVAVMQFQHDSQPEKPNSLQVEAVIPSAPVAPKLSMPLSPIPIKPIVAAKVVLPQKAQQEGASMNSGLVKSLAIAPKLKPAEPTEGYSIDSCKVITDHFTKLEWLVGPDQTTSWEEAQTWLREQNDRSECGGRWRIPAGAEVKTLHRPTKTAGVGPLIGTKRWPAHLDPIFSHIGEGAWVWLKTSRQQGVTMNLNRMTTVSKHPQGNYTTRVFAVRDKR